MKELNLIPYKIKEEKIKRSRNQSYVIYLLLVILILVAGVITQGTKLFNLNQNAVLLQKQVQKGPGSISENVAI